MGKLIDADAFRNYLEMIQEANKDKHKEYVYYLGYAIEHLNDFTEVEGIEIVCCKDCTHWYEPDGVCLKIYSDGAVSPYAWQDRNPDDFCSYGERRLEDCK